MKPRMMPWHHELSAGLLLALSLCANARAADPAAAVTRESCRAEERNPDARWISGALVDQSSDGAPVGGTTVALPVRDMHQWYYLAPTLRRLADASTGSGDAGEIAALIQSQREQVVLLMAAVSGPDARVEATERNNTYQRWLSEYELALTEAESMLGGQGPSEFDPEGFEKAEERAFYVIWEANDRFEMGEKERARRPAQTSVGTPKLDDPGELLLINCTRAPLRLELNLPVATTISVGRGGLLGERWDERAVDLEAMSQLALSVQWASGEPRVQMRRLESSKYELRWKLDLGQPGDARLVIVGD